VSSFEHLLHWLDHLQHINSQAESRHKSSSCCPWHSNKEDRRSGIRLYHPRLHYITFTSACLHSRMRQRSSVSINATFVSFCLPQFGSRHCLLGLPFAASLDTRLSRPGCASEHSCYYISLSFCPRLCSGSLVIVEIFLVSRFDFLLGIFRHS
jgi:hypothetical protein